jgi:protease-4
MEPNPPPVPLIPPPTDIAPQRPAAAPSPASLPPIYVNVPAPARSNGCLIAVVVLLVIALLGSLLVNVVTVAGNGASAMSDLTSGEGKGIHTRHKFRETLEDEGSNKQERIVRIDVDGIISSGGLAEGLFGESQPMVDNIKQALDQAVKDKRVKAIVISVNSPGGEVTASDILYDAVKRANAVKPVVIYMESVAASGGYYLSCGASKIVASETTLTGSIGVIMESMSYHGLFDKVGMSMNTFTSGPMKDTLSGARPMRDDEKAYIQSMVNSMYDRFVSVVSEGRKIPKETLKGGIADGRVYNGREALAAKLVDQIGYVEDAYKLARSLGKSPNAPVVKYGRGASVLDLFSIDAESRTHSNKVELQLPGAAALPKLLPGRCYYLPYGIVQ